MNKKVLIISGSARQGGISDLLCDEFIINPAEDPSLCRLWDECGRRYNKVNTASCYTLLHSA